MADASDQGRTYDSHPPSAQHRDRPIRPSTSHSDEDNLPRPALWLLGAFVAAAARASTAPTSAAPAQAITGTVGPRKLHDRADEGRLLGHGAEGPHAVPVRHRDRATIHDCHPPAAPGSTASLTGVAFQGSRRATPHAEEGRLSAASAIRAPGSCTAASGSHELQGPNRAATDAMGHGSP